jgi:TolB-like protein/tetratricopeptide (TPR) repeat protein
LSPADDYEHERDCMQPIGTTDPAFARDAFISYANQDTAVAAALCASLEQHGLRCWIAPRDVMPGALYADAIVRAISGARVLILVLSQHSVSSPHVGKEIERASSKRRPIIALRIDAAPLTPALEYFLSESQWVDASSIGIEAAQAKLAEAVRARLGGPPILPNPLDDSGSIGGAAPGLSVGPATTAATATSSRSRWPLMAAFAVAALVAAAVIGKFWFGQRTAATPAQTASSAGTAAPDGPRANSTDKQKSVAVLPFEDLSQNKDQAYFSDGLSGELIDLLAKVSGLRVPARMSSFYFKGKQAKLQDIAHALNVTHVLEGTVRTSGQTLRITADLVSVDTGTQVWSESYDRKLDDVFKIQDDIAGSVVGALKVSLLGKDSPRAVPTANAAAYTAYLKCQEDLSILNREGAEDAVRDCQQAVDLDPNFARAWLGLAAAVQFQFVGFSVSTYEIARPRAYAAIQRALALEPNLGEAHYALAELLYQMDFEPAAAAVELQRATQLAPSSAEANWLSGYINNVQCRYEDALRSLSRARGLDPLSTDTRIQIGNVNYRWGKLEAAAAAYHEALGINALTGSAHYRLGLVALQQGNPTQALAEFEQERDPDFRAVGLPMAYDALGRKADAERALASAEKTAALGASYQIALVYAARKDSDKTFEWLNRAYAQRDTGMLWIKGEPFLRPFHSDPRFKVLLGKMHLS